MRLATSDLMLETPGFDTAQRKPGIGYAHPSELVDDPRVAATAKRAILAMWASDAAAVRDQPGYRWLLGTPDPVPLEDVREARARLDRLHP